MEKKENETKNLITQTKKLQKAKQLAEQKTSDSNKKNKEFEKQLSKANGMLKKKSAQQSKAVSNAEFNAAKKKITQFQAENKKLKSDREG